MAAFTDDQVNGHDLDWEILRDGGISLYRRTEALNTDVDWLRFQKYEMRDLDCSPWESDASMHEALSAALAFPAYYGHNLHALNDCISEDLDVPDAGGFALCLRQFNRFSSRSGSVHAIISIFARASRVHMLRGRRFLVLIQSDDPRISFESLGCVSAKWNRTEWLSKNRGL